MLHFVEILISDLICAPSRIGVTMLQPERVGKWARSNENAKCEELCRLFFASHCVGIPTVLFVFALHVDKSVCAMLGDWATHNQNPYHRVLPIRRTRSVWLSLNQHISDCTFCAQQTIAFVHFTYRMLIFMGFRERERERMCFSLSRTEYFLLRQIFYKVAKRINLRWACEHTGNEKQQGLEAKKKGKFSYSMILTALIDGLVIVWHTHTCAHTPTMNAFTHKIRINWFKWKVENSFFPSLLLYLSVV